MAKLIKLLVPYGSRAYYNGIAARLYGPKSSPFQAKCRRCQSVPKDQAAVVARIAIASAGFTAVTANPETKHLFKSGKKYISCNLYSDYIAMTRSSVGQEVSWLCV
ncbi:hypothetical protein Nepgr_011967 [Nepenthes gracilis]|uniref:Uncharacterized protein n=1 Tax=Nepenthes gracilis TaxID=150966 RepID=A0AAD3XMU9_NEPGR|nr:hypothetical protein Nepgr_011967 [Nepenthes gracilis]